MSALVRVAQEYAALAVESIDLSVEVATPDMEKIVWALANAFAAGAAHGAPEAATAVMIEGHAARNLDNHGRVHGPMPTGAPMAVPFVAMPADLWARLVALSQGLGPCDGCSSVGCAIARAVLTVEAVR